MTRFAAPVPATGPVRRAVLGFLGVLMGPEWPFLPRFRYEALKPAPLPSGKATVFEVSMRPDGRGYQAQFFRDGVLMARTDIPPEMTIAGVDDMGTRWFDLFDPDDGRAVQSA